MRKFEGFQKGVNLGGWISQYAEYDPKHFEEFITEKDIAYIASLGFDHVRVPVDCYVLEDEDGNYLESGFGYLESCLGWCRKYKLRMLIDLHECYGYSFDPSKKTDKVGFFFDPVRQARFLKLWEQIAQRFGPYPDTVALEPLNEVVSETVVKEWNGLVRRWTETVRRFAPESWLVVGGVQYNHVLSVALLDPPYDERVVYNFHCYEPLVFTHQGAHWMDDMPKDFRTDYPKTLAEYRELSAVNLENPNYESLKDSLGEGPDYFASIFSAAVEAAEKYNVPLYCGEYGVIDLADNQSKIRWLRDIHTAFDRFGIGRALWNYKEKDFGLVDESFEEIREDFCRII